MRLPHIGIDARLTAYRGGGISETIIHLIAELEQIAPPEPITIFHSRKARARLSQQFSAAKFRAATLWTPPHHRLESIALAAELVPHRLDIWHATDFIPPVFGARRYIASIYDLAFLHYPQFLTAESRRYYNGGIARAARQADHILTISQASKRDIMERLGVSPDRISVHLLAADARYRPLSAEETSRAAAALGLPPRYFLFVGTFEPRKNILGLLHAYRLLRDTLPDAPPLVIAGRRGWLFEETMAAIGRLHLSDHVVFRENVQPEHMPALYNRALVLALPSHYEGFGLPALEAMACGTIPLVSDRSSLPEVVGEVGLCLPPDDAEGWAAALLRAATDEAWRAQMRTQGMKRAAQFSWRAVAETTLAVYRQVA